MNPLKILVAEDDPVSLVVLTHFLGKMKHRFYVATDGATAYSIFLNNAKHYDLIITDYDMPGLNGCELYYSIRYTSKIIIPFIGISALDLSDIKYKEKKRNEYCLDLFENEEPGDCFDVFLRKPISYEDLERAIEVAMEHKRETIKRQSDDTLIYKKTD